METDPDQELTPGDAPEGLLEVSVARTGGMAGLTRRWHSQIPDDDGPAARAARRVAQLGEDAATVAPPGRVRDGFLWTVQCEDGELRCDDATRRSDEELSALISEVTEQDQIS